MSLGFKGTGGLTMRPRQELSERSEQCFTPGTGNGIRGAHHTKPTSPPQNHLATWSSFAMATEVLSCETEDVPLNNPTIGLLMPQVLPHNFGRQLHGAESSLKSQWSSLAGPGVQGGDSQHWVCRESQRMHWWKTKWQHSPLFHASSLHEQNSPNTPHLDENLAPNAAFPKKHPRPLAIELFLTCYPPATASLRVLGSCTGGAQLWSPTPHTYVFTHLPQCSTHIPACTHTPAPKTLLFFGGGRGATKGWLPSRVNEKPSRC